jgi:hypothetical protein
MPSKGNKKIVNRWTVTSFIVRVFQKREPYLLPAASLLNFFGFGTLRHPGSSPAAVVAHGTVTDILPNMTNRSLLSSIMTNRSLLSSILEGAFPDS